MVTKPDTPDVREFEHELEDALLEAGVPTLHFYTMGKANPTAEIARRVFGTVAV